MNEDKDEIEFSYEVFDRQLDNFCRMLSILVDAWEDYSPQELTFDIRSLCTKATRLCYMAEKDMVLQHNDIAKQRKEQNETHEVSISIIVMQKFTPPDGAYHGRHEKGKTDRRKTDESGAAGYDPHPAETQRIFRNR